ncbi:GNAT family N-acetyltransferase [Patescibacteria group bacterium]|nr:GNAT family N-acetyltransferase [Patescibacteria group bacterium]MBU4580092.1 GNAT family N-acetyltransferase [Patescibacteria group bacterium]
MTIFTEEILEKAENEHYRFQIGCYFSGSEKVQGALLLRSKIKDSYWNYATKINISEGHPEELISKIADFYKTKNRQPAIYFTPFTKTRNLPELIGKFGFKLKYKDAWMFYESAKPKFEMPESFMIKPVETSEEMKIFTDIFRQSYGGATPDEPYGALPKEYGECIFESFSKQQKDKKVIHYLGILGDKPVGIATLIYFGEFGCIFNVGTIPIHRKKGMGKALTLNAAADSIKSGAKIVFLQTEHGSFNEKYYAKLGFSTKFIGEGFVLG